MANFRLTAKLPNENGETIADIEINLTSRKSAVDAKEQLKKAGWDTKLEMTKEIE